MRKVATNGQEPDRLVPATAVATVLGVSRNTVVRWGQAYLAGKDGGLRCVVLPSGRLKFRWSDVEGMLGRAD